MLEKKVAASVLLVLFLTGPVALSEEDVGALGLMVPGVREGNVPDPYLYYPDTYPAAAVAGANPLLQQECTYEYVYSEGRVLSADDTIFQVTSFFDTGVDWAFEVDLPNLSPCEVGYLKITWDAQAEVPEYDGGGYAGIGLVCEVEQMTFDGLKIVPCPGTHVFNPFIIRTDSFGGGELAHCSYQGVLLAPAVIDGDPLGSEGNPVTVRIGFVQSHTSTPPYPTNSRVANQNMVIDVGPAPEPPPPPQGGEWDRD